MSDDKRQYKQIIMKGLRESSGEGRKDVEELQKHLDGLLPRTGGEVSGAIGLVQIDKQPDTPQKGSCALYYFKNGNGPSKVEIKWDDGNVTTVGSHP